MIGWLVSYLVNHSFQVRINDIVAKKAAVPIGIPQGYAVGLLLCLAMLNEHLHQILADDAKTSSRHGNVLSIQFDINI